MARAIFSAALLVLVVLVALVGSARAATNKSGTISANETWDLAGSPYVLTGNVTVAAGVALTIEEGVVVQGNHSLRTLTVNGTLSAVGTSSQPITFTSTTDTAPGQWLGIVFGAGSIGTLKYVNARYGGGGAGGDTAGMVKANGGTVTLEDSTFRQSSTSGVAMSGGTTGANMSLTVRRSKFESNGFYTSSNGDGLNVVNGRAVVEDSAFWSNKEDGVDFTVASTYSQSPAEISGSSMYKNGGYGLYLDQGAGAETKGPDGNIAGEPGNVVYENGTLGFSQTQTWQQLKAFREALTVDWRGTYWGPVAHVPCGLGSQNGHLSFGAPDPNPTAVFPVPRGPVSYKLEIQGTPTVWCANDYLLVNPAATEPPPILFPPPPLTPVIGREQTFGCTPCHIEDPQVAPTLHEQGPLAYTEEPVSTASGSLTESATDLRLAGPGTPFTWTRSYNSGDSTAGALGTGWAHPYDAKLTVVDQQTGELEYRAGSGQRTRFTKTSGGGTGAANYAARGFDGTLKRLTGNNYELKTGDHRTFSFDTAGKLTGIKPRFGPATTLAYDGSNRLSSITDSAGRTISITYSLADPALIERVTLPDSRYVEYGYTSGRLTSVRDPRGKVWTLGYNASNRLTSIQDPLGHYQLQNVVYDGSGRVTSEQNGVGDTISYAYTTSGDYDVTTVTIPGRGDWVYKHRSYVLFSVTDPLGRTSSYTYDLQARKATEEDARGNVTRFEYDERGNTVKEVAPGGLGTVTRTFNATNDLLSEQDARLNTTSYAYATTAGADYQVGQLKTITDREGGVTTLNYWTTTSTPSPPATNVGLLKSTQNPRLKTTSHDYDSSGNLTKITSPLGLKTTFTYDGSGRKTSRRDPRGNVPDPPSGYLTQWAYDAVDHVTTLTDARGNATNYEYYNNELLWKQTRTDVGGAQRVTSFEYDNANRLWKSTDPRNGVETRLYWPDGQLKSVESAEGRKTTYNHDNAGQLITVVEPNGNAVGGTPSDWTWTYGYDDAGNRTSEQHPDGGTRTIEYNALDRPFRWTDPLSHVTSVEYDENGNVKKRTDGLSHFRTYTFDKLDRLKTESDERSKSWTRTYYATGELESVTTPLGNKTTYAVDDDGRTASTVEARGNVQGADPEQYRWLYQYDENGNRTGVTDPLANAIAYEYNALGDVTKITDQRGNETAFTYDAMNRLDKVTPPGAGATGTLSTDYTYDAAGNLATRTDPKGHVASWTYDLDGRQTQRTTPVGTWNSTYDANSNLKTLETPAGSSTQTVGDGTITYGYDRMSRQTSVDYSDSTPDVARAYDSAGRLQTMTDGSGTVSYTFDNADRLTDFARSGGGSGLSGTFSYGYDDAGNITGRTYPDATAVAQTFDDDGRHATVASGGQTTSFGYDAAGNLASVTLPSGNGHVASRTFDRAGRLTTVENAKAGTTLSKFLWTLDAAGNPTKAQTTRGAIDSYDAYEYDARNRLTASCFAVSAGATNCSGAANAITYAYDKVSNRTQEVRTGNVGNTGTIDYTYNDADQLTQSVKGGNTTSYSYDANGNQGSIGSRTFTYDLADRLVSTTSGGTTTTYGYDGDDRRVSSTVSAGGADLRYVWDPLAETGLAELALERTPGGSLARRYVSGPLGAISLTNISASFYYHHDPLGTVTDVTDASGVAQWKYEYEAYGAQRSATDVSGSAPENRLRFTGQYLDPETTQYHLRARQYDPASGRFGGLDPVDNPLLAAYDAAYVYAGARPTVLTDPSGLDPSLGGANVNCRTNAFLCVLIYNAGYQDGCSGHCVMRAVQKLESRGIALDKIVAAANGKGKIVPASNGPDGPGVYFVGGKKPLLLEPPSDPTCGFVCSIGLAATKVLGCNSNASCIAAAAMTLTPGAGACRVGRAALAATKGAAGLATRRVRNKALQNILNDLYKAGDRIGGGTAGALREEARTGIKVAGKNHRQKAGEYAVALQRLLAREKLTKEERYVAVRNLRNLQDAIRLFDQKRPNGYIR